MIESLNDWKVAWNENPPAGYRFLVFFQIAGTVPNPLDIRIQKVSGISSHVETTEIREGGENIFRQQLPNRVNYNNLVLEQGLFVASPLNLDFSIAMTTMTFIPSNVLVTLLGNVRGLDSEGPVASWVFWNAYPVGWDIEPLDATKNDVAIEVLELAYTRVQHVRL
jgi:phage tail-like protein